MSLTNGKTGSNAHFVFAPIGPVVLPIHWPNQTKSEHALLLPPAVVISCGG